MRKIVYLVIAFSLVATMAFAMDTMITVQQLPQKAQDCIKTLYPNVQANYVEKDFDGYEISLANGAKIDFYNNGEWENISNYAGLPDSLLPAPVLKTVKQAHPQALVVKIEKEWDGFEVKLNNQMEMKIDKTGRLIGQKMDD